MKIEKKYEEWFWNKKKEKPEDKYPKYDGLEFHSERDDLATYKIKYLDQYKFLIGEDILMAFVKNTVQDLASNYKDIIFEATIPNSCEVVGGVSAKTRQMIRSEISNEYEHAQCIGVEIMANSVFIRLRFNAETFPNFSANSDNIDAMFKMFMENIRDFFRSFGKGLQKAKQIEKKKADIKKQKSEAFKKKILNNLDDVKYIITGTADNHSKINPDSLKFKISEKGFYLFVMFNIDNLSTRIETVEDKKFSEIILDDAYLELINFIQSLSHRLNDLNPDIKVRIKTWDSSNRINLLIT